jgi:L-rhamnose mutarotase
VQHFGLTLCLRDDPRAIAEYRRQHAAVWPAVLERLRACGVHEMRIFLLGRRMFMYLETDDAFEPRRDFARINDDPVSADWNVRMAELQERAPEAPADEWWALMEPVFVLSSALP